MSVDLERRTEDRMNTDPRISRRRKAVARSKRRRILIGLAGVAVLLLVIWTLFMSPVLSVRDVKVLGESFTTEEEVIAAAGLTTPEGNLLLLGTDEIARKVEELPWVRSADVDRMLPGTVRIKVVERAPALVLSLGAATWTIDVQGNVLASGEAIQGLPVLAGVEVGDISPGLRLLTEESSAALKVFRSLPRSLRTRLSGIFAPTVERISFSLDDGTVVRYGAAEQLADKNEVLKVLLDRLETDGSSASYIDVRVPASPAISTEPNAPSPSPSA
jgi:cell division protein FtsQ